jgi:precorrin-3B C17-methyltransferase
LLHPIGTDQRRLDAAAQADFAICLYNPSSRKRHDYLKTACEIILRHRNGDNAAGIVRNIGRDGECAEAMTLAELKDRQVDMFTTVFIGIYQNKKF